MEDKKCYLCVFNGKEKTEHDKLFPWKYGDMDVVLCKTCHDSMIKLNKETMSVETNYKRYLTLKNTFKLERYFGERWEFSIGSGSSLRNPDMCFLQTLEKVAFFNQQAHVYHFWDLYFEKYKLGLTLPKPEHFNGIYVAEPTVLRPDINYQLEHTHFNNLRKQASLDYFKSSGYGTSAKNLTTENTNENLTNWSEYRHYLIRGAYMKNWYEFEKEELLIETLVKLQSEIELNIKFKTEEKSKEAKKFFAQIMNYCANLDNKKVRRIVKKCALKEIKNNW